MSQPAVNQNLPDVNPVAEENAEPIPEVSILDNLGEMSEQCRHCGARFFQDEVNGKELNNIDFCCKSGSIDLIKPSAEDGQDIFSIFKEPITTNYDVPDNLKFSGKLEGDARWSQNAFKDKKGQPVSPSEYFRYLAMTQERHNLLHDSLMLSRKVFMDVWASIDQDHSQGSYRTLDEELLASKVLFSAIGDPHWSITFTCNEQWPEIQENLVKDQGPHDRPDLIARVFKMKVDRMMHHLVDRELLGKVKAYALNYEWQQLGLPHIHLLLTMEVKPSQEDISRLIWDHVPKNEEALAKTVRERMLDSDETVSAYNPDLLRIFNAHINVKPCHENNVKYPQREKKFKELKHDLENRHICAPEACHRLFEFPIFQRSHEVGFEDLPIHLPFANGQETRTPLTEYFRMNARLPESERLSYTRFPSKYEWTGVQWQERTDGRVVRGTIDDVPIDEELPALRLLLIVSPKATCFEDLLRVENSQGLIHDNNTFETAAYYREMHKNDDWYMGADEI